jgi:hypothetical protein
MLSAPFSFSKSGLYAVVPVSTGYGDKLRRAIDAADPGAVPGGSTITFSRFSGNSVVAGVLMGPN